MLITHPLAPSILAASSKGLFIAAWAASKARDLPEPIPIIKKLGGGIKTALAQYRELEAFAQFASDLDEASKEQLEHGERVTELTKQDQFSPMSVAEMGLMLFTANEGYLRKVEVEKIKDFEKSLIAYMNAEHKELMDKVSETGEYGDDIQSAFTEALDKFMETQTW